MSHASFEQSLDTGYWERAWAEIWDAREAMYVGQAHLGYWQERARDFSDGRRACDYDFGSKVVEALFPFLPFLPEKAKVLDVGAGPGSLVIPFARLGCRVTAVEPVQGMQVELEHNAQSAGIVGYDVLPVLWQDVDVQSLQESFDLVISAITMWMFRDLRHQLERMERVSRRLCCVVGGTGSHANGHDEEIWTTLVGKCCRPSYSEFPLVFNLLHSMGRLPEVRIITYETERSLESKVRQQKLFYAKYVEMDEKKEKYIEQSVIRNASNGLVREKCMASVVFWDKRNVSP